MVVQTNTLMECKVWLNAIWMDGRGWIGQTMDGQTEGPTDGQMGGDINAWMEK